jgi:hypothetical protein
MGERFMGTQLMPAGYESFTLWRQDHGDPIADAETLDQFARDLQVMANSGFYDAGTVRSLGNAIDALEGLYAGHPDVQVPYSHIEDILIGATVPGTSPLSYLEAPVFQMKSSGGITLQGRYSVDFNPERRETEDVSHAMVNTMLFLIEQHPLHVEKGQCLVAAREAQEAREHPSLISRISDTLQSYGIGIFASAAEPVPQCLPVNREIEGQDIGRSGG